jgi:hypothetical protein
MVASINGGGFWRYYLEVHIVALEEDAQERERERWPFLARVLRC